MVVGVSFTTPIYAWFPSPDITPRSRPDLDGELDKKYSQETAGTKPGPWLHPQGGESRGDVCDVRLVRNVKRGEYTKYCLSMWFRVHGRAARVYVYVHTTSSHSASGGVSILHPERHRDLKLKGSNPNTRESHDHESSARDHPPAWHRSRLRGIDHKYCRIR